VTHSQRVPVDKCEWQAMDRGEVLDCLKGLVRYCEAVRYTAGMGEHQLKRLEAAKALIAKLEASSIIP
jgi:hypothetical protein